MKQKDPIVTYFNQEEEDWNKPWLGETNKLKSSLDPQRKEWQTETTGSSIEYKEFKDLITDLENKHSTSQTKQEEHQHSPMQENQIQKLKDLTKSSKRCDI